MNSRKLVTLGVVCLLPLLACSDDEVTGTNGNGTPSAIQTGVWTAATGTAAFAFDFTVGSDAESITGLEITCSSFQCGNSGVIISGTISTTYTGSGLAINNRAFTITQDMNYDPMGSDWPVTISGTFANSGDEASGTWEGSIAGGTCSGTWTAAR
jgi:hypothetical protein